MRVYRERFRYKSDVTETEILDVIKSISVSVEIRRNYALILSELPVDQSVLEKAGKNVVKCGFITLFRTPSAIEVYISQTQSCAFSVLYHSESSSRWRMFGVYFAGVPFGFDEYTFIGEV